MRVRDYLKDVEGDPNGVVREDYTHYTKNGQNLTKVKHPNMDLAVVLSTTRLGKKLVGRTQQFGAPEDWNASPFNIYLHGAQDAVKSYWNSKAQGEKPLPPWLERTLKDHISHFYGVAK